MTSHKKTPKPYMLALTAARVELLSMALFDQLQSLKRTLRLQEANPHLTDRERYEIKETRMQLTTCSELHKEVVTQEMKFKEW